MAHLTLPSDLPVPQDDGACSHLAPGTPLPSISLPSTKPHTTINLSTLPGRNIIFFYPRTAAPDEVVPSTWNAIPGARGCTPQVCSFRDLYQTFSQEFQINAIFGCSTQSTAYQTELKERVHLPYELLSDEKLGLAREMRLPTMEWEGRKVIKRMSLVVEEGRVVKCFYPVFPPDTSAEEVLEWLRGRSIQETKA